MTTQHGHGSIQLSPPCLSRTLSTKGESCTLFSLLLKEVVRSLIRVLFLVAMDLPANNYYAFSLHPFHPSKETRHFVTKDLGSPCPTGEMNKTLIMIPAAVLTRRDQQGLPADMSSLCGLQGPGQGLIITTGRGQTCFSSIFPGP